MRNRKGKAVVAGILRNLNQFAINPSPLLSIPVADTATTTLNTFLCLYPGRVSRWLSQMNSKMSHGCFPYHHKHLITCCLGCAAWRSPHTKSSSLYQSQAEYKVSKRVEESSWCVRQASDRLCDQEFIAEIIFRPWIVKTTSFQLLY